MEVEVDMPEVVIESSNTASFGGISEDGGFGLPVYNRDIGTLNDDYDFWWVVSLFSWKLVCSLLFLLVVEHFVFVIYVRFAFLWL